MPENKILKTKNLHDIASLKKDVLDCQKYIDEIKKGNVSILYEANAFANKKHKDYFIHDAVITLANTDIIPSNRNYIDQTIVNLEAIQRTANEIIIGIELNNK